MKKLTLIAAIFCLTTTANSQSYINAFVDQHVSCYGNHDGRIQCGGDNENYYFKLKGRKVTRYAASEFNNLAPGTYTITAYTIPQAFNVPTTSYLYLDTQIVLKVTTPKKLSIRFLRLSPNKGKSNGVLEAIIKGGTCELQPYLTTWSRIDVTPNILLNPVENFITYVPNITSGTYQLTIEDDRGCFLTKEYILKEKKN